VVKKAGCGRHPVLRQLERVGLGCFSVSFARRGQRLEVGKESEGRLRREEGEGSVGFVGGR
jgi:hypothetical protein